MIIQNLFFFGFYRFLYSKTNMYWVQYMPGLYSLRCTLLVAKCSELVDWKILSKCFIQSCGSGSGQLLGVFVRIQIRSFLDGRLWFNSPRSVFMFCLIPIILLTCTLKEKVNLGQIGSGFYMVRSGFSWPLDLDLDTFFLKVGSGSGSNQTGSATLVLWQHKLFLKFVKKRSQISNIDTLANKYEC